jgi:hypothetical protein
VTHWLFHLVNTCFTYTPIRSVDNACKKKYTAYEAKEKAKREKEEEEEKKEKKKEMKEQL